MNGMDMLISNLLKASGVDPEKVKADVLNYARDLAVKISSMDAAMTAIRDEQAAIRESIEGLRKGQTTVSQLLLELSRASSRTVGSHANGAVR